jgi:DNA-binding IclR family transcriptional regulator
VSTNRRQTRPLSSALKIFALLDAIADSPGTVQASELARRIDSTRAAVHQQLVTLVEAGWVEQLGDRSYRLTMHAARVGQAALTQAGIGERVRPVMEALVTEVREAVSLAVIDDNAARIIDRAEPDRAVRVNTRWESRMPIKRSALGKVLVAHAGEALLERLEASGVELPDEAERSAIRDAGHAFSSGNWPDDVRAVAAPLFDFTGACVAALSLSAPEARFDGETFIAALESHTAIINAQLSGAR